MNNAFTNFAGQVTFARTGHELARRTVEGHSTNEPIEGTFDENGQPATPSRSDYLDLRHQGQPSDGNNNPYAPIVNGSFNGCSPYQGGSFGGATPSAGCSTGYDRSIAPESLMADSAHPVMYLRDKARSLPPWISDTQACDMQRVIDDYTQVGTVGQSRTALQTLYALGGFLDTRIAGVIAGNDCTATIPINAVGLSIGFRLDWGVAVQSYAPFDMNIVTTDFIAAAFGLQGAGGPNAVNADRVFTTRVSKVSGGSIFVPFAVRTSPGMSIAQQAIATTDAAVNATIAVTGLPAALAAAFSMQVTLLTAFHPLTAQYAAAMGLLNGGSR